MDVERAVAALAEFWRGLTEIVPGGSFETTGGVTRLRSGVPVPTFNGVMGFGASVCTADVLAAVDSFIAGDLPWNVQLRPGYPDELDVALAQRGLVAAEQIPLMVLTDLDQLVIDGPLEIRPVFTFADADAALTLIEQGFEMPAQISRHALPIAMFGLADVTTWLGRVDGVDVTTALGTIRDRVCGIFNVATPAEHRGKGYGAAITSAPLRRAWDDGCDLAYLQSSALGYPVYERLGFATAERWTQWLPAEYAEDHS